MNPLDGIRQDPNARPYFAVYTRSSGIAAGILDYRKFESKEAYQKWLGEPMFHQPDKKVSEMFTTVAEGVSEETAKTIVHTSNSLEDRLERASKLAEDIPDSVISQKVVAYLNNRILSPKIEINPNMN